VRLIQNQGRIHGSFQTALQQRPGPLRQQHHLQSWKKKTGEEKKAEAIRLFAEFSKITNPRDPEAFERIIGPELILLEETATGKVQEASASTTDPNFF